MNIDVVMSLSFQLFLSQGKDILIGSDELHIGKAIGKGAFATVFEATLKKKREGVLEYMYEHI